MKYLNLFILFFISQSISAQDYFNTDTTYVMTGKKYHLSTKDLGEDQEYVLYKVTSGKKNILLHKIEKNGSGWQLVDFNKDGYLDIQVSYMGNNPSADIFLFNPLTDKYIKVVDFINFPQAKQLKSNPQYYYSYCRAGCADMNWVSDLFIIKDYKAIHIAQIYGEGCVYNEGDTPKIEVSKVLDNNEENKQLVTTLPYTKETIGDGDKWTFIELYWNKNYKLFR